MHSLKQREESIIKTRKIDCRFHTEYIIIFYKHLKYSLSSLKCNTYFQVVYNNLFDFGEINLRAPKNMYTLHETMLKYATQMKTIVKWGIKQKL